MRFESVVMMTPDETPANAILRTKRERREHRQSARFGRVPLEGWGVEGSEGLYYLLERVPLAYEYVTDEHGHRQSCTASHFSSVQQHASIMDGVREKKPQC